MGAGTDKRRIYQDVVHYINTLIKKGRLGPGDKLPPERKLADDLNVSRNSVREAIRVLSENGILTSRQGAGTFISSRDRASLIATLADAMQEQQERLQDIFEFRRVIEPQIAALAARHISPEQLEQLKALIREQEQEIADGHAEGDHDARFHSLVAAASGNHVFKEVMDVLNKRFSDVRSQGLLSIKRSKESVAGHWRIFSALEMADDSAAMQAMHDHLISVEQNIF